MKYTRTTHPLINNAWTCMKSRCNPKNWNIRPAYQGCIIHDDWNNFQNFAEDYTNMVGYGLEHRQLDKDLLNPGNKLYSKNNCVLVPQELNVLLVNSPKRQGHCPIGVYYDASNNGYVARIRLHGNRKRLGLFKTPVDAFNAYKIAKESHIKEMAEYYKHEIDSRVYDALMNYNISIDS